MKKQRSSGYFYQNCRHFAFILGLILVCQHFQARLAASDFDYRDGTEFYLELNSGLPFSDLAACSAPDGTFYMAFSYESVFSVVHFFDDGSYISTDRFRPITMSPYDYPKCHITSMLADEDGWIAGGTAGWWCAYNPPTYDLYPVVVAYDNSQTMRWSKTQGYTTETNRSEMIQTTDNDYVFLGTVYGWLSDVNRIAVSRFSPDYSREISYKYTYPDSDILGISLAPANNDCALVMGYKDGDSFLLKLNPSLGVEENLIIHGAEGILIPCAFQCEDGTILLAGNSGNGLVILHLDESMNLIWGKRVPGLSSINKSILPYNETSFVLAGNGNGINVMNWTYNGALNWTYQYTAGQHDEFCRKFLRINEDKYVLCGAKTSFDTAVMIQTDGDLKVDQCSAVSGITLEYEDFSVEISDLPIQAEAYVHSGMQEYSTSPESYDLVEICYSEPIPTPTSTSTPTNSPFPTLTPTGTPTQTPTFILTNTPTFTATCTPTNTPSSTATCMPTDTPTPTYTPSPDPTHTPANTPTSTPTNNPTPEMTSTPPTSLPTQTPITCDVIGVKLWMPAHEFHLNDRCSCNVTVCNTESETLHQYPLFVVLYTCGMYFFAPSFSEYDNYLNRCPDFPPGETHFDIISNFSWPDTGGSNGACTFFAALLNPELNGICGTMDTWDFEW